LILEIKVIAQILEVIEFLLIFIFALTNLAFMQSAQASGFEGFAVKFYDGDNITIVQSGIKTKVRLACIDAPELKQKSGQSSRKVLKSLVAGKRFRLNVLTKDRFGRLIAEVFITDKHSDKYSYNVNKALVEQGHAHFYNPSSKGCEGYASAEQVAQAQHLGIWQDGDRIELPSEFRRENY